MLLTKNDYLKIQKATVDYFNIQRTTMLVVIDPAVEAPYQLAGGVQDGAEVLLLDPHQDSIAQITTALTAGSYHSLHLVSHGSPGCLHLGNTDLSSETIVQYKQQLLEWGIAEILIYGCNVAASPELPKQLHSLTGASIAASAQKVGQGNWNLEWQIGEITSDSAFAKELRQEYQGSFIGFESQITFTAGNDPSSVAVGDLDGDGNTDMVIANAGSDNVSIFLGDGSGGFSAQTTFGVGDAPYSVVIGDLDGDDNVDDIVVANIRSDNISVLLGNNSGGFSGQTTFASGNLARPVAIGDLDGDGNADDVVVAGAGDDNIIVLLGDNSGGFSNRSTFEAGNQTYSVEISDFNEDGNLDIVAPNRLDDTVSIFLGVGSGSFSAQTTISTGPNPTSVAVEDFDEDGNFDFVVTNSGNRTLSIFLGDGSGNFSAQTTFSVGSTPLAVAVGDIDSDDNLDLVVANASGLRDVSVLLGNGSGSFASQETFSSGGGLSSSVAIGDLDGDGNADDFVVGNRGGDNLALFIECFLTGTRILTDKGEIAVEKLKIGDQVQTADGKLEAIKWIGRQTIEPHQVKNPLRGYPILIKAGALGNNLPHRDLYVSPDHSMFIEGLLINAGALVNDLSIIKTEPTEDFTYYHIELENHALLIAEGTAAESYLPQKENRDEYDNFAEYEELYPHGGNLMLWPMDYPRISSRHQVPRFVSKKLLKIAHQLCDQNIQLQA